MTAGAYQLFGGDAADDAKFSRTFVFLDGEVLSNAAVSLEILSEKPLGVGVSHGWTAKRMSELIDAVLAYSGISMERPVHPRRPQSSADALRTALHNLHVLMQSTSAVVQYSQMPDVPMDKGTLSRIFQNLLGNAMKYRGPDPPRIEVAAWRGPKEWIFSVSDNGEGIAHEYRERVFEPFRRLHGRQIPGSGIGLSLCREMISQYDGRIWFDSEPGEGATFFFTVPDANVTPGEGEGRQNSE